MLIWRCAEILVGRYYISHAFVRDVVEMRMKSFSHRSLSTKSVVEISLALLILFTASTSRSLLLRRR